MTEKRVSRKAVKTAKPVAKKADGEAEVLAKIAASMVNTNEKEDKQKTARPKPRT